MRAAIVGSCGHGATAFTGGSPLEWVGYCPGYPGEDLSGLEQRLGQPLPPRYPDFQTLLLKADPELLVVDGVYGEHAAMSIQALDRGIHVYCDKPAATSKADLIRLGEAAASGRGRLFSMLTSRYQPWFYQAKKLVKDGAIGKILLINGQKSYRLGERPGFYYRRESFGGLIPWVAIHMVDLILWLTEQRCLEVTARHRRFPEGEKGELESTSLCLLELSDQVLASVSADYCRPGKAPTHDDDRLRIVGTQGILDIQRETLRLTDANGERILEPQAPPDLFAEVLCCIQSPGRPSPAGMDGLYSTLVCLTARDAADRRKTLPVPEFFCPDVWK